MKYDPTTIYDFLIVDNKKDNLAFKTDPPEETFPKIDPLYLPTKEEPLYMPKESKFVINIPEVDHKINMPEVNYKINIPEVDYFIPKQKELDFEKKDKDFQLIEMWRKKEVIDSFGGLRNYMDITSNIKYLDMQKDIRFFGIKYLR